MRKTVVLVRLLFCLGISLITASAASAYTGTLALSRSSTGWNDWENLGTIELLPPDVSQTVSVPVILSITGVRPELVDDDGDPTTDPVEEAAPTYTAATSALYMGDLLVLSSGETVPLMNGQRYVTVDASTGEIPASVTMTVSVPETAAPGYYGFTVTVTSDMTNTSASMRYVFRVDRVVGDLLTVSPSTINVRIPQSGVGQQTFAVHIANADPDTDPYEREFDWSATTSADWISLSQARGSGSGTISVLVDPQTMLPATIDSTYGGGLTVGDTYTGTITIYNTLNSTATELTVNATVVPSSTLPLQPPMFQQVDPEAMLVTATDASWVNFQLCATQTITDDVAHASGGPFSTDYPSYFVTIELPQMLGDAAYALTNKVGGGGLALVGYRQSDSRESISPVSTAANNYSYADVPITSVPFGPFQLLGLHGTATVRLWEGPTLDTADEVYRVQVNIQTLDGSWRVTENWQGESYTYGASQMLNLVMDSGQITYSGVWGTTAVTVAPGDGYSYLYRLSFTENGYNFIYEILSLSGDTMSGRYRFSGNGAESNWETFRGQRVVW